METTSKRDVLKEKVSTKGGREPYFLVEINNLDKGENQDISLLQPYKLWSLLDMIVFSIQTLCQQLCGLQEREDKLQKLIEDHPESADVTLSIKLVEQFNRDLSIMLEGLKQTGLISAPKLTDQILARLSDMSFMRLHENIIQLREMIIGELKEVMLVFIPREKSIWIEKARNIDRKFIQSFPSALDDFKEALFTYIVGRYTASVFHCMRILEYGLKALAKDVGLSFDVQQWYTHKSD